MCVKCVSNGLNKIPQPIKKQDAYAGNQAHIRIPKAQLYTLLPRL